MLPADAGTAVRFGCALGIHLLLVLRLLHGSVACDRRHEFRAMALVTAAIVFEGFAPEVTRVAPAVRVFLVGLGLFLIALTAVA